MSGSNKTSGRSQPRHRKGRGRPATRAGEAACLAFALQPRERRPRREPRRKEKRRCHRQIGRHRKPPLCARGGAEQKGSPADRPDVQVHSSGFREGEGAALAGERGWEGAVEPSSLSRPPCGPAASPRHPLLLRPRWQAEEGVFTLQGCGRRLTRRFLPPSRPAPAARGSSRAMRPARRCCCSR